MTRGRLLGLARALGVGAAATALCACEAVLSIPDRKLDPNLVCSDAGCMCAEGYASCDGDDATGCETDLRASTTHCGACGHDCLGGACDDGQCRPVTVLAELNIGDISVVGDYIYVTSLFSNPIRRIPRFGTGEGAEPLGGTTPGWLLREDKGVLYWTTGTQVMSLVIEGGGAAAVLAEGVAPTDDMAVGGGQVYFINYVDATGAYTMASVPVTGGPVHVLPELDPLDEPWSVIVDASRVYWSVPGAIVQTLHGADAPASLGQVFGLPFRMIRDQTDIYWIGDGIFTMPLTGAAQRKVGPATPTGNLAADATDVYFATESGTVERIAKAGGAPVVLATGQLFGLGFPSRIVVDDRAVYWVTQEGIQRLAK